VSSYLIYYSTMFSEHNWEDLGIKLGNQQIGTPDNHNQIRGGPVLNPIFANSS
jgi:hypothetical protein